eukprot:CAMPEP_0194368892 /NCGR_PEP_ID=MMETSP0174-20130528/17123_1 /TAXON_ID=216777 /ORGANISM="Proboscia alata, Strain PI-D3" /LENGTH=96 /DNA_ID=CAMNT_0039145483 /DNA_START=252 /DNA_END=543 /DNA_ORIENTATION=-
MASHGSDTPPNSHIPRYKRDNRASYAIPPPPPPSRRSVDNTALDDCSQLHGFNDPGGAGAGVDVRDIPEDGTECLTEDGIEVWVEIAGGGGVYEFD